MVERREIVRWWREQKDATSVLATLVRVEGSSYRRPGARLCIYAGGHLGSISGGCLEGEIARKARWLTRNGATLARYSTLYDDAIDSATDKTDSSSRPGGRSAAGIEIPYGLGCGGVIDVLLEPLETPEARALLFAMEAAQKGNSFSSITLLPSENGSPLSRVIFDSEGAIVFASGSLGSGDVEKAAAVPTVRDAAITTLVLSGESRDIFAEAILPPQRLVILGAGEDARPLSRMAHAMGWRVAVADGRSALAQATRFPDVEQVTLLVGHDLRPLRLTSEDAVAIVTHSFEQDRNFLPQLLPLELRYLGLLGARHRSQLLLTEVSAELGWTFEDCLRQVHAPIGLDLGGDTPEAVALTILAEIQSALHHRDVVSQRTGSDRLKPDAAEQVYVPVICPLDEFSDAAEPSRHER